MTTAGRTGRRRPGARNLPRRGSPSLAGFDPGRLAVGVSKAFAKDGGDDKRQVTAGAAAAARAAAARAAAAASGSSGKGGGDDDGGRGGSGRGGGDDRRRRRPWRPRRRRRRRRRRRHGGRGRGGDDSGGDDNGGRGRRRRRPRRRRRWRPQGRGRPRRPGSRACGDRRRRALGSSRSSGRRAGVEVTYSNGVKEEIENGRFEQKDAAGRTVIERPATAQRRRAARRQRPQVADRRFRPAPARRGSRSSAPRSRSATPPAGGRSSKAAATSSRTPTTTPSSSGRQPARTSAGFGRSRHAEAGQRMAGHRLRVAPAEDRLSMRLSASGRSAGGRPTRYPPGRALLVRVTRARPRGRSASPRRGCGPRASPGSRSCSA